MLICWCSSGPSKFSVPHGCAFLVFVNGIKNRIWQLEGMNGKCKNIEGKCRGHYILHMAHILRVVATHSRFVSKQLIFYHNLLSITIAKGAHINDHTYTRSR